MEDLPPTQSQELVSPTKELIVAWARLQSRDPDYTSIDLLQPTFKFGRDPTCDIISSSSSVSKVHFTITNDENTGFAYIRDTSRNGTFVHGAKIGKGKQFLLGSGDDIATAGSKYPTFTFYYNQLKCEALHFLPEKLSKKYIATEFLGKGGFGEVRRAFNKHTCQPYAVKKIIKSRPSHAENMNHPLRIETEINILKTLRSDYIIKFVDFCESDNEVFLVLEYMPGGELSNRINSDEIFLESEVKFIFYQIVLGVQYLHDNNITHRDLKPENILLSTNGRYPVAKITDFGLSKIMDEISQMETICGTWHYVAPEVIVRNLPYGQECDVWSMGVILFYMLSHYLPFASNDRDVLMHKILRGQINWEKEKWKKISHSAQDLVKKMLVNNPRKRIKISEILNHPWIHKDVGMRLKVAKTKRQSQYNLTEDEPFPKRRCFSDAL